MTKDIRRIVFISLLLTLVIHHMSIGQADVVSKAQEKIKKIESFKKYKVMRFTKEELAVAGDSAIEMTGYLNTKGFGKDFIKFKNGTEIKEITYYHYDDKLFAFREVILRNAVLVDTVTYYFSSKKLYKVVNAKGTDLTSTVNERKLMDDMRQKYGLEMIVD